MARSEEVRYWLRENGYGDIADTIDEIIGKWKRDGKHTRRNWWDILAGTHTGQPRTVGGMVFPVLRSAQKRQGLPVTPNAISRKKRESIPEVWTTGRWPVDETRKPS